GATGRGSGSPPSRGRTEWGVVATARARRLAAAQAARRHHRNPPQARMRPCRGRDAGRVRHQPARALDQGHGLLLPRRVPHRVAADRARLRPRAGQEVAVVHARAHDRGTGARYSTLRQGDDGLNGSSRLIRITEHYVRMDYEGNDEAALYRCTSAGEEGVLLLRDGEPDVVREDVIPFAAMTPVIVTHRFFGRSIA